VMDKESQAVLNVLTEHDFQEVFKNGRSTGNGAYARNRTTSRVILLSQPKVRWWPVSPPLRRAGRRSPSVGPYASNKKHIVSYC
jgi:hypothetical protein